jgi:hypothetical protein
MNLSSHPEKLCVRFDIPRPEVFDLTGCPEDVSSRHEMERALQASFYGIAIDTYVAEGEGTLEAGHIFMLTDTPAVTLQWLTLFLSKHQTPNRRIDLLPYVHLAWFDKADNYWRTFFPQTTRPFWTLLCDPAEVKKLMEAGKAAKA